ncbi:MAG: hypothetical protein DHS20C05_23430 [Hyphococcus sp.]|nr:MAG: hypothetical protein DHS20C05_23430 [Marinicaulis sp.]
MKTSVPGLCLVSAFSLVLLASPPALAQLSVTTFGATDAQECYQNASSGYSRDTGPCDEALSGAMSKSDRVKTLVNRGIIHNHNGDLGDAISDFNEALDGDSGLAEAYINRGNSFFLGGQFDNALSDYESSLALNVSEPWAAWYNIGLVHDARNDEEKARAAYEEALAAKPGFELALAKLEE